MKKTLLSLTLGLMTVLAHAQEMDYFLVVPNHGKYIPASGEEGENGEDTLSITLTNSVPPPAAVINTPYEHDLSSLLQVIGDPTFQASEVLWSVVSGSLPDGLTLSPGGVLAGTPTIKDTSGTTVELQAVYKTESATQVFTLYVNGLVLQATKVFSSYMHACAITPERGVKCWGDNSAGQVGKIDPEWPDEITWDSKTAMTPVAVQGLSSGVQDLELGEKTSCAILTGGAVRCWGSVPTLYGASYYVENTPWPVEIPGLPTSGIKKVAIGGAYDPRFALTESGDVYAWQDAERYAVKTEFFGENVVDLAVGNYYSCALYADGSAKCFGWGNGGQLGDGIYEDRESLVTVAQGNIVKLRAMLGHVCAVISDGTAKCWGYNGEGQLGNGTRTNSATPQTVLNLSGVVDIAPGGFHTCALVQGGAVKCWGAGETGALGNGIEAWDYYGTTPEDVIGLSSGVVSISTGYLGGCAVKQSGETVCWGWNSDGQVGDGTDTDRSTPVETLPY